MKHDHLSADPVSAVAALKNSATCAYLMAPNDFHQEQRIAQAEQQFLHGLTRDERRAWFSVLVSEVKQRSPGAVRELELQKGLVHP